MKKQNDPALRRHGYLKMRRACTSSHYGPGKDTYIRFRVCGQSNHHLSWYLHLHLHLRPHGYHLIYIYYPLTGPPPNTYIEVEIRFETAYRRIGLLESQGKNYEIKGWVAETRCFISVGVRSGFIYRRPLLVLVPRFWGKQIEETLEARKPSTHRTVL